MEPRFNIENVMPPSVSEVDEALKGVRAISTPVSPGLFNTDYAAVPDDQRLIHSSTANHTLTLPIPKLIYKRRAMVKNSMRGGNVTVLGSFLAASPETSYIITNPVLKPGEGLEYLGFFDTSGTPDDTAPTDFRMNGKLSPNAPGKYRIAIVVYTLAAYTKEQIDAKFSAFEARLASAESSVSGFATSLTSAINRIAALENKKDFTITKPVALPVLTANATLDIKVSFPSAMPNLDYSVTAIQFNLSALLLGKISIVNSEQIKTLTDVTVRIKTSIAITLTTESITLLIVARSN